MLRALKYIVWFTTVLVVISDDSLIRPPESTCNYDSCGTSNDQVKNVVIKYAPDPLQFDKNITLYFSGYLTEEVDKGLVRIKGFFGTQEVCDKTFDLCSGLPSVNLSCPLYKGPLRFQYTPISPLPPVIPRGVYGAILNVTDGDDIMFCMKMFCSVY